MYIYLFSLLPVQITAQKRKKEKNKIPDSRAGNAMIARPEMTQTEKKCQKSIGGMSRARRFSIPFTPAHDTHTQNIIDKNSCCFSFLFFQK